MLKGRDNGRLNGETKALLSSGDAGRTNGHACANIGQNNEPGLSYAGIKDTKLAARSFVLLHLFIFCLCVLGCAPVQLLHRDPVRTKNTNMVGLSRLVS